MYDQIKMEELIMSCWNVTDDIDVLLEEVCEGTPSQDRIANVLNGLRELYEIKFASLFRMFEAGVNNKPVIDKPASDDVLVKQALNELLENKKSMQGIRDAIAGKFATSSDSDYITGFNIGARIFCMTK